MIITSNKDRELAIKALNGINSQNKDQILGAVNIINELLHKMINSAAIYGDLQEAKRVQLRDQYYKPFMELSNHRIMFCSGSAVGDLSETLKDFCLSSNPNTAIHDDRASVSEEEDEDDEEEYEDDDEEEEEGDQF